MKIPLFSYLALALVLEARPGPPEVPEPPPDWVCSGPVIGPEALVNEYGSDLRDGWLADPQHLLRVTDFREQQEFLAYHASDSGVAIRCLIFDRDDTVPAELEADRIFRVLPPERKPTVLLHYFRGAPERARLAADPVLAGVCGPERLEQMRREAVLAAGDHSLPAEALSSFCVQASIQALAIERMLEHPPELADSSTTAEVAEVERPPLAVFWQERGTLVLASMGMGSVLFGFLFFGVRRASYGFPDLDVEPRFGAAHAAGVGAVVSFGDTTQSAGSQKERSRDPLGGR